MNETPNPVYEVHFWVCAICHTRYKTRELAQACIRHKTVKWGEVADE